VWPAILTLFIDFLPIKLKQLNFLTAIDTFSCLGGVEITHRIAVRDVPVQCPALSRVSMFVLVLLLRVTFLFKTHFVMKFCNFFCNFNSFRILSFY